MIEFEHNYGHGNKYLNTLFAYLMMLVFFIDQVLQIVEAIAKFTFSAWLSFLRKQESLSFNGLNTPAFAGVTKNGNFAIASVDKKFIAAWQKVKSGIALRETVRGYITHYYIISFEALYADIAAPPQQRIKRPTL